MDPIPIYAAYLCAYSDEGGPVDTVDQWSAIAAEALTRGVTIAQVFSDTCSYSDTSDNRPGLQQAIAAAKAGKFQSLFISAHDRLARAPGNRKAILVHHLMPHKITLIVAAAKGQP